eukprot:scaffold6941_cov214-Pinguiococcus_pyrenoidosus.AAC.7
MRVRTAGNDSDDENERNADIVTEEDLKHIVDEVSDNEGDESLAEIARREDLARKEKEELGEVVRKMREGYTDGRSNRSNVRGAMKFEQLTAASKESREEAKRLGLHLSDEEDSDNEDSSKQKELDIEELDEVQLADLLVKDMRTRFQGGRRNEEFDELFGESDDEDVIEVDMSSTGLDPEAAREAQEVAEERRWKKRARMRRALMHVKAREATRKQKSGTVIDLDDESQVGFGAASGRASPGPPRLSSASPHPPSGNPEPSPVHQQQQPPHSAEQLEFQLDLFWCWAGN